MVASAEEDEAEQVCYSKRRRLSDESDEENDDNSDEEDPEAEFDPEERYCFLCRYTREGDTKPDNTDDVYSGRYGRIYRLKDDGRLNMAVLTIRKFAKYGCSEDAGYGTVQIVDQIYKLYNDQVKDITKQRWSRAAIRHHFAYHEVCTSFILAETLNIYTSVIDSHCRKAVKISKDGDGKDTVEPHSSDWVSQMIKLCEARLKATDALDKIRRPRQISTTTRSKKM
jgi:hypothetical protein